MSALALLQEAVNAALRFDPETRRRLGELDGRVIGVSMVRGADAPLDIYIYPSEAGVRLAARHDGTPDVTVSATSVVFARLALGRPLAAGELQLSGDIALGQKFQRLLGHIDIDWEEQLARLTGDVAAHQLARAARAAAGWGRQAAATLGLDLAEYLQEESRLLARRARVEAFLDGVDRLRADAERLEQRLRRLGAGTAP